MDRSQLKQRIVGAIVLVALGVIFIPMILNRDENPGGISGTNIPPKPQPLQQLTEQKPPAAQTLPPAPAETRQLVDRNTPPLPTAVPSPEPSAVPSSRPTPDQTATPTPKPTQSDTAQSVPSTPHGWVVQLGSFSERKTALRLRDHARKAGYRSFVESVSGKRGTLYRVRVGPVPKQEQAKKLQKTLNRKLKLKKTLIQAYP